MNFKNWLNDYKICEQYHAHEDYEDIIAEGVFKLVNQSVKEWFSLNKTKKLSEIIVANSKGLAQLKNFGSIALPENGVEFKIPPVIKGTQLPKEFENLSVRIKPSQKISGADYGSGIMNISINTSVLQSASKYEDQNVQNMLLRVQYQLHHESTHISSGLVNRANKVPYNPYLSGSHPSNSQEYNKGKIDYYTDPGELRAHAKQYAVLYSRFYPGQPFDQNKMMNLTGHSDKIERYFKGLGEQPGQSKIWGMNTMPHQQQLSTANQQFMNLVKYFISKRT